MDKYFANKGVERNKKPLQNICYKVEVVEKLKTDPAPEEYTRFRFKDLGYLILNWGYEKDVNKHQIWNWHGFITPEQLKKLLGEKQWAKLCQGKREFVIQRRVEGRNISKKRV